MNRNHWLTIVMVFVLVGALPSVVCAESEKVGGKRSGFWVEEAHIDLGSVVAGTDAVGTYVFHNDTDKEVKIIKAKPS